MRNNTGVTEFSLDALKGVAEKAIVLSEKYDIDKKVIESGFYTKANMDLSDFEINEDVMYNFIKENSTDEFQKLLYDMVMEEQVVDMETIINNPFLLPNEQISLVILNNVIGNNSLSSRTVSLSDCRNEYNDYMSVCTKWLYVGTGLTVATAVMSFGTVSTLFAVATTLDYEHCSSGAMDAYMKCVESVK